MPELPEVETIKNELSPHIIGRSISGVTLLWEKISASHCLKSFTPELRGKR